MYIDEGIRVLTGLEGVRLRPAMYIGSATPAGLVEWSLRGLVRPGEYVTPSTDGLPTAVRLIAWRGGAFTIALDGCTLPTEPLAGRDIAPLTFTHPALYERFFHLAPYYAGPVLNALTSYLEVAIVVDGHRCTCAFSRGGLVRLLGRAGRGELLGDVAFTFEPDATVVPGELTAAGAAALVATLEGPVSFVDRSAEYPR